MPIITGTYGNTWKRDEITGLTSFSFITASYDEFKNKYGAIQCLGHIPVYAIGTPLKLTGGIVTTSFGKSFRVTDSEVFSDNEKNTIAFLSENFLEGIREKRAKQIVAVTGPDIFSFIKREDAKEILMEKLKGFNEAKIDNLIKRLNQLVLQKDIYQFLSQFGADYSHAIELATVSGASYMKDLDKNAYDIGTQIGLPFWTCDSIAKYFKYYPFDERRIEALLKFAFSMNTESGNVYATLDELSDIINSYIVKNSAYSENVSEYLLMRTAAKCKDIYIENAHPARYYLRHAWYSQNNIVYNIKRIMRESHPLNFDRNIVDEYLMSEPIQYSSQQIQTFDFLQTTGIKILTGGPGTGKTTVIKGLINLYKIMNPGKKILLCAPTGRAAQRMNESTGYEARTVHRMLNIDAFDVAAINKEQLEPINADFIILDEASMLDEEVFSMLLRCLKDDVTLILCGDINQLPSVGAGNVLKTLIETEYFEVNVLSVIYRQANDSTIISNAIKVNIGDFNLLTDKDFKIVEVDDSEKIPALIEKYMQKLYNPANPFDIQVLCSSNKGSAGTRNLNKILQEVCNPSPYPEFSQKFKINDKVIMTRNNYDSCYMNGDVGTIKEIDADKITVSINDTDITVTRKDFKDISLAYSMTIHKAQGSEYSTVFIVLPSSPKVMLKRNLLYTAITRAKERVCIVAEKGTIELATTTYVSEERQTMLKEKITGYVPELLSIIKK